VRRRAIDAVHALRSSIHLVGIALTRSVYD
jgi:hypothetical protein